jgi:hypothetical protein
LLVSKSTKTLVPTKASERMLISGDGHRWLVSLREGVEFLWNVIFQNPEILGFQVVNVVAFVVGDLEAEHDHVHLHAKGGTILRRSQSHQKKNKCESANHTHVYLQGVHTPDF